MDNITYEAVTRAILPDYEKLILPVVFRELLTDAEPIENGFLCIGARVAGKPVAAIVVFLEEYGDLDLRSLYVLTAYRRKRIASSLTLRVVQVAAAPFKFDEEQEEISFKVMYSLPEPLKKDFEAFLQADGFYTPERMGKSFELDSRDLAASAAFAPAFREDFIPKEEEDIAVVVFEDDSGRFILKLSPLKENLSRRRWLNAVQAAIASIARERDAFTLFVPEQSDGMDALWEQAVGQYGHSYEQCITWQDIKLTRR